MKLLPIEGNTQKLDGGAMFGNAPREMWKRWISPDEKNRIPLACRALYLETDNGRRVLFDVGVGACFEPKLAERYGVVESEHMLLKNLRTIGVDEAEIDVIILSHMHFDHAGGLLSSYAEGEARLLFPNAQIYTSRANFERAKQPEMRDRASFLPHLSGLLQDSGRLTLLDSPTHPDLDFVTFCYVDGHTPGLMLSEITMDSGEPLLFVADLVPGMPWIHLPITMGYDRFPELTVREKTEILTNLIERNGHLFFTHDPVHHCAHLIKDEKGRFAGEPVDLHRPIAAG